MESGLCGFCHRAHGAVHRALADEHQPGSQKIGVWLLPRSPRLSAQRCGPGQFGRGLLVQRNNVADIQRQIEQALRNMPEFNKIRDNIKFGVTGEGLRIDLLETEQGMFFISGNASPTPSGERLLSTLAGELKRLPNRLAVEGHTDARPFRNATPTAGYSN